MSADKYLIMQKMAHQERSISEPSFQSESAIRMSKAIISLFVRENTFDFTVKQLSQHAGVSERTFHRYFPRKEDVVRPSLALGAERLSQMVASRPGKEPLIDVLKAVFSLSWWATHPAEAVRFRKLMHEADYMRAVWIDIITQAEDGMARAIASRLDPAERPRAPLIASVVYAAIRRSIDGYDVERQPSLSNAFAANLDAIADGLFPTSAPQGIFND